jgi:protein TonB
MSKFNKYFNGHAIALASAIMLHGGIAAWAMQPDEPVAIAQQVIQISMVAPSSIAQEKPEQEEQQETPKDNGVKKAAKKQENHKKQNEKKEASASTPATSGPQSPDAVDKVAARSEPVFNAAYLQNPAPAYPPAARKKGAEGKVLLEVAVTTAGKANSVSVSQSSGSSLLDEAALAAVRNWKFIPAKQGGEIVEAKVIVPVEFKLN